MFGNLVNKYTTKPRNALKTKMGNVNIIKVSV